MLNIGLHSALVHHTHHSQPPYTISTPSLLSPYNIYPPPPRHTHTHKQRSKHTHTQVGVSLVLSFMIVWDLPTIARGVSSLKTSRVAPIYNEVAPSLQVFGQLFGKALGAQVCCICVCGGVYVGVWCMLLGWCMWGMVYVVVMLWECTQQPHCAWVYATTAAHGGTCRSYMYTDRQHQHTTLNTPSSTHPQTQIAAVNTALTATGMWLLKIPGMGILSLFVFLCGFIPIAGCFISTIPIGFVALTEYGFMKV